MSLCVAQLNASLFHMKRALFDLNSKGNVKCYPGFRHDELSDSIIKSMQLLETQLSLHNTWTEYKYA